ncbi:hypothetical protein Tco_1298353 [Tanacetum coccineum]
MGWWTRVLVEIDFFTIIVRIPLESGRVLVVQGNRSRKDLKLVSVIKMRKYLEKDCVTFMAHIVDKGANVKSIQNILIERNHIEVFPKDLSRLPPTRIVEFWIDLVPGAAPVAKAPYRLTPSKMQELSRELQELLRKGLIRPSSLPWDAPDIHFDPAKIEAIKKWVKITMDLVTKLLRTSRGHDMFWEARQVEPSIQ